MPIDGAMSLEPALESAGEPTQDADDGSMVADPEPTVHMELRESLLRTVVPPPSVSVEQELRNQYQPKQKKTAQTNVAFRMYAVCMTG